MNPVILDYITEKIIHDLRAGNNLPTAIFQEFNKYPFIDYFRNKINKNDIPFIITLLESDNEWSCAFGLSLSKNIVKEESIKKILYEIWEDENSDYKIKREVMWRILDIHDLPLSFHKEIYDFVKINWERWTKDTLAFYGGENNILEAVINRSNDPSFPESKKWIYICLAVLSPNKNESIKFIKRYLNSNISMNSLVAKEMISRLDTIT